MRRPRMWFGWRALALAVGVSLLAWGMGTSASQAQMHHGGHHGGHDTTVTTGQPGTTTTTRPLQPGEQTTAVQYGPYNIQAAPPADPGQPHSHVHSGNQFAFNVQKPCTNCFITGMRARLVGADRTTEVGHGNRGLQLHHMVLFNQDPARQDATCYLGVPFPLGLMFGQRFFASGDERTPSIMPPGYGYYQGNSSWNLIWDLASASTTPETVYYEVKFTWIPAAQATGFKNVEPIWFDIAQCGFSTFNVPAGRSQRSWTWTVNRPGAILGVGGHVHDGGINLEVRNDSTGRVICDSRAGYGETPLYVDDHGGQHLSSMSTCGGQATYNPADVVTNGQRITITSYYDMPQAVDDQMGISIAYIGEPSAGGGGGTGGGCVTATNAQHVQAGRATQWLVWAWARGSNASLGSTWATTSLREGPTGTWTMVTAC
jgi:hypothetical protein